MDGPGAPQTAIPPNSQRGPRGRGAVAQPSRPALAASRASASAPLLRRSFVLLGGEMAQSGRQLNARLSIRIIANWGSGSRLPWGPRDGGGGGKRDPTLFWGSKPKHILSPVNRSLRLLTHRTVPLRLFPNDRGFCGEGRAKTVIYLDCAPGAGDVLQNRPGAQPKGFPRINKFA